MQVTIGADPELFAFRGNTPVSVHDLLPGSKWSPCKVPMGAIQVDGVAAEFNIEPAATKKDFIKRLTHVHKVMEKILKNRDSSLVLKAVPTVHFDGNYFDSLPDEAKALGCEPDYSAYTMSANPKPERTKPMATGSGHVHIGWSTCNQSAPDYPATVVALVKELDFVLYRQSMTWDADEERMQLYGQPGSFRFKPYGLEYRVLSNKWLESRWLMAFVFDAAKAVAERVLKGETFEQEFAESHTKYEDFLHYKELPFVEDYKNAA